MKELKIPIRWDYKFQAEDGKTLEYMIQCRLYEKFLQHKDEFLNMIEFYKFETLARIPFQEVFFEDYCIIRDEKVLEIVPHLQLFVQGFPTCLGLKYANVLYVLDPSGEMNGYGCRNWQEIGTVETIQKRIELAKNNLAIAKQLGL